MDTLSRNLLPLAVFCIVGMPSLARNGPPAPNRITVRIAPLPGAKALPPDAMSQTLAILSRRIGSLGVVGNARQVNGDTLAVTLRNGQGTAAHLRRELELVVKPARLEFIWLKNVRAGKDSGLAGNPKAPYIYEGEARVRNARTKRLLSQADIQRKILYADPKCVIVSGSDLKTGGAQVDIRSDYSGSGVVTMLRFNDAGGRRFGDFTRKHIGSLLAIVLNGRITSAPRIKDVILDGTAVIEQDNATVQGAQELADLLNAGALPVALKIVSMDTVETP